MNPVKEIISLQQKAKSEGDPLYSLCILSTAENNRPHARIIELDDILDDRIGIVLSNSSPKWKQLVTTGLYELLLYWNTLLVQIRINGSLMDMESGVTKKYWRKSGYEFRLLDWYHYKYAPQSSVVESHTKFLERMKTLKSEFPFSEDMEMPPTVKGFYFVPQQVEFWRGNYDSSFPLRELFTLNDNEWSHQYLLP